MINITDIYGKQWSIQEQDITELYFDNTKPCDWMIIVAGDARIIET